MNLVKGEKITSENLLYGILVHSANDAAFTFAENKGYDTFIRLMNEKAKQIHMKDSSLKTRRVWIIPTNIPPRLIWLSPRVNFSKINISHDLWQQRRL